ncbi:MAG TPA: lytic murein transglycosylase, partial [Nocardioidaceae bacterium]|nr:lytic murein transglycosylase [Nocardioidaceae bacterium]
MSSIQFVDAFEPAPSMAVPDNTTQFAEDEAPGEVIERVASSRTVNVDPQTGGVVVPSSEKRLLDLSAEGSLDIPAAALTAYRQAAATLAHSDPSCNIDWALMAGIGRVESDHGRYGGARVAANGKTYPHILGVALDGSPGVAAIADTDGGTLDSDTTWDRAVGPMQFIPGTWAVVAADGDGDGERDPHDLDDAALAAGAYLCAGDRDVSTRAGAEAAVFSYNQSDEYVAMVLAIADAYRNGEV